MMEMGAPMTWASVLNPEAVLDCSLAYHNASFVKFKVDTPRMTDVEFVNFVDRLNIQSVVRETNGARYGAANHLERGQIGMERGTILTTLDSIVADVNLSDPLKGSLYREYGLDKWLQMRGVLPSVYPGWNGISIPDASVFTNGACSGLSQGMKQLARFHYLEKGQERLLIVPQRNAININSNLRSYLSARDCPAELTQCPTFLNHGRFMFEEDFLVREFNAKAVDVNEGEAVLIQAGVYAQIQTKSAGCSICSNCVPCKWLELNMLEGCEDGCPNIPDADVLRVKRHAVYTKEYAAAILKLSSHPPGPPGQINIDGGVERSRPGPSC